MSPQHARRRLPGSTLQPLIRQMLMYGAVGGAQLALDYLVFIGLTAVGLSVIAANLTGRVVGASLGYYLNRRVTFTVAEGGQGRERNRVLKFCAVWISLTIIGTAALELLASSIDLKAAWIAKPVVDGLLAVAGFVLSKYWIYR